MTFQSNSKFSALKLGVVASLLLGGCIATTLPYMRAETAQRIASPAWMIQRDIPANEFNLLAYERIHDKGGVANIYIEGDGEAFTSKGEWETNPTPRNPVALHLASKDKAENVIYLARPCQFIGTLASGEACDDSTWKSARFSGNVIAAYDAALDEIALRYDITGFNVIGYSGGAAIATLIAKERRDVLSLRTVAGILDHKTQSTLLGHPELTDSLNPVDEASTLVRMPQYHFVGGQDQYVPPAVLHSYLQSMPPTHCVQSMVVQEASYDTGWVDKWPELLTLPVRCYNQGSPHTFDGPDLKEPSKPVFTVRETPLKP